MSDDTIELIKTLLNGIWAPASVDEEPLTELTEWSVRRVSANFDDRGDSIHFVGHALVEGRVSSPIQDYDPVTRRGTSRSGRIYQLTGTPGYNPDAEHVWRWYMSHNGNPPWKDVTSEY